MNLFDRLRKPDQRTVASAIRAIPLVKMPSQNSRITKLAAINPTGPIPADAAQHVCFRHDLCANEPEPTEITQVNDITFHLVTSYGWQFEEALTAAAVWVGNNARRPDKDDFNYVMRLATHLSRSAP